MGVKFGPFGWKRGFKKILMSWKGLGCRKGAFQLKIWLLGKTDVLKEWLGRKGAFGSAIEFLWKTDVLKGFLGRIETVWVENGSFMNINVLKGFGVEKGPLGRK